MRFAVIGDIHGNIAALDAVLEDIDNRDVDFTISTGDLAGYLPWAGEVIDRLRKRGVPVVMGNNDLAVASKDPLTHYLSSLLSDEERGYLKSLPANMMFNVKGKSILVVHGSPRSSSEYMYEDEEVLGFFERTTDSDVIISGHTHVPYFKALGNKHFINAGSVGKPKHGGPEATYVIVTVAGETECEIIAISYDVEGVAQKISQNPHISDKLIDMLRKGY